MSKEVYLEGYSVGEAQVIRYLMGIHLAKNNAAIGTIAGRALKSVIENETLIVKHTFCRTQSWQEGFFDGFLEKAQEIRKK